MASPLTHEMKPFAQIEKLKNENEELQNRLKFMEQAKAKDMKKFTDLEYEYHKLKMENRALKRQANDSEQLESVDLKAAEEDEQHIEGPVLVKLRQVEQQQQHQQQHQGRLQCSICDKTFVHKKSLKNHMGKIHGLRQQNDNPSSLRASNDFRCSEPGCNFKTVHKASFYRHIRSQHMITIPCPFTDKCKFKTPQNKIMFKHLMRSHGLKNHDIKMLKELMASAVNN
jgi:uncharacterized C2H2 Zn-finger protein